MELYKLTVHEAAALMDCGEIHAKDLTQAVLGRMNQVEQLVKAFVSVDAEAALQQAEAADARRAQGSGNPPLTGIPMGLKDNLCTQGMATTCGSKILEGFVPPYSATAAERLFSQHCVLVGKLNMDEFAMGSSTEHSAFFKTINPWDAARVPGGSSGGSAAAVAADEVFFALGSDTGGSIRQPASFCGVVGLKPTYGAVSRYGLVAFASSLDQIGPLTKDVTDCAWVLNAIADHDPKDSTSAVLNHPDYTQFLKDDVRGLRIGVPKEYFGQGLKDSVRDHVMDSIRKLEAWGAVVEEISLPAAAYALSAYYIISSAEASSNLSRYDGIQYGYRPKEYENLMDLYRRARSEGFGPEVKRRIMLGTYALSTGYYDAYYLKALKVRTLIKEDFDRAFERYDLLVSPTCPTTAFPLGAKAEDPMEMYLSDVYTVPVNIAGLPAMSIPCGYDEDGLPIGLQLIGRPFDEGTLLRCAYTFEQNTDYHLKRPQRLEVL